MICELYKKKNSSICYTQFAIIYEYTHYLYIFVYNSKLYIYSIRKSRKFHFQLRIVWPHPHTHIMRARVCICMHTYTFVHVHAWICIHTRAAPRAHTLSRAHTTHICIFLVEYYAICTYVCICVCKHFIVRQVIGDPSLSNRCLTATSLIKFRNYFYVRLLSSLFCI